MLFLQYRGHCSSLAGESKVQMKAAFMHVHSMKVAAGFWRLDISPSG